jgi:predicted DNA-binding transcriptional regulator YafY
MANDCFKRYVWLIDLLQNNEVMTFKEISKAWQEETALNPKGEILPLRTFNNHIKAIKEIFDIEIYFQNRLWQINPQSWIDMSLLKRSLLAKLSLNNAILEYESLNDRIIYEENIVPDNEVVRTITHALSKQVRVIIDYRPFGKSERTYSVDPYCLKMSNHRWYLLGYVRDKKEMRVFALDERLLSVETPKNPQKWDYFNIPRNFDGKAYFDASVGVIVNPGEVEAIRIKAFDEQADFWRSTPIHHSQKEVETGSNYAIFELQLNPDSIELEQLLFSKIDQIEVLAPLSLRKKMMNNIAKMAKRYS